MNIVMAKAHNLVNHQPAYNIINWSNYFFIGILRDVILYYCAGVHNSAPLK